MQEKRTYLKNLGKEVVKSITNACEDGGVTEGVGDNVGNPGLERGIPLAEAMQELDVGVNETRGSHVGKEQRAGERVGEKQLNEQMNRYRTAI